MARQFLRGSCTLLASLLLWSCGSNESSYVVGVQHLDDLTITVESRPAPPRAGHNEVVVGLTKGTGLQPIYDAQVHIRANSQQAWTQAIEDGHVGVYRRALDFGNPGTTQIEVQILRGNRVDTIAIPVQVAPKS